MKRLLIALQLLTILPVRMEFSPRDFRSAVALFPVVGALQGSVLVVVAYISTMLLESTATGLIGALVLVALTCTNGGFHLDGFADTVDGLAGGNSPEERLKIMGDHTTGAIGVVFIVLLLILKYAAIVAALGLESSVGYALLFLFPVVGRWAMVPVSALSEYARAEGGLGAAFCSASVETLFFATLVTLGAAWLLSGLGALTVIALLLGALYFIAAFFRRKLGGATGDVLGFVSEIGEVLFLVGAVLLAG